MSDQVAPSSLMVPAQALDITATASSEPGFHTLLSELNPLQYLPVVGTIYRAVTGDTISETARVAGSLVVSGLLGGPVGVVTNLATYAAEKITGIDPEAIGSEILASLGIGGGHDAAPSALVAAKPAPAPVAMAEASPQGWSPAQLTAYGVTADASGTLQHGTLSGADVLNDMELTRVTAQRATLAYAAHQPAAES
jgi:hypothetical protein